MLDYTDTITVPARAHNIDVYCCAVPLIRLEVFPRQRPDERLLVRLDSAIIRAFLVMVPMTSRACC